QMLAGLNLNNGVTGYGIIGTCVTAVTGAPGAGLEGCPAGQVMQHGSAHLRRNATTRGPLANGNFSSVAGTLLGNGPTGIPTVGTAGGLLLLPDSDPATAGVQQLGGVTNRRMLRNGCDRLAAG